MPDNKGEKPKSFLQTVREIDAADRKAELVQEAKKAEERAAKEELQRRAYEEKLKQEKLELMKLKQGLISDEDIPKEEKVEKEYTFSEKVSNFFYHYKWHVIVGTLGAAFVAFLVHDYVTTERPDIQGLYIALDYDMAYSSDTIKEAVSEYCPEDYNGDGEKMVKIYYVPAGYSDDNAASMYLAQGDRTKLIGEFQSGNSVMIIGDKYSYGCIGVLENCFADCRELFPDDPYAEELGYRLAGTDFKELIGRPDMDDSQLYVSFRLPMKTMGMSEAEMQKNFDRTVAFWRNFLAEHRIDGVELEPTEDPELPPAYFDDVEESETNLQ